MNHSILTVYAVALGLVLAIYLLTIAVLWRIDISKMEGELGEKKMGWHMVVLITVLMAIGFIVGGCPPLTGISTWPWQLLEPSYLKPPILAENFSVDSATQELTLLTDAPKGQMWVIDPRTSQPYFAAKGKISANCTAWRVYFQDVSSGQVSPAVPVIPGK